MMGFRLMIVFGWILFLSTVASAEDRNSKEEKTVSDSRKEVVHLTAVEQEWLNKHAEIRWGEDPNWPPFSEYDSHHNLVGIDADIVRLAAARVGLKVTPVQAGSWTEILAKAKAGQVDFLSATAVTPERLQTFDYTKQYGEFPVVIITRQRAPFLTPTADLRFLTISAPRDDVVTLGLERDYPKAHFILTDTAEQAINLVSLNKADATVQNLAVACRIIRVDGLSNLKISGVTRYEYPLRIAVRKDLPELASILNKALATITSDEQESIYAAHLTPDIDNARDWGAWRRLALRSIWIGAIAVGAVLLWNHFLMRQIRRRKVAEAALRETRNGLEKRTHELADQVSEAHRLNSELRLANQDLESFSSSVSHDLRSPVRRIGNFADLLQAEVGNQISTDAGQWMSTIIQESRNMDRLIHDLLEFSRVGRIEFHKQPVSMQELVKELVIDFKHHVVDRKVVWEIGDLGEVEGDPNLLRYALANLIDNALKYTRRRPEARIRIGESPGSQGQQSVEVFVQDNGCGFDMSRAKHLFGPFQRLHSNREYEGTGIGLASVKRIIQRHGGKIRAESEPNKGATFYFTLTRISAKALAS
jgi:signal transduction histidine kinase